MENLYEPIGLHTSEVKKEFDLDGIIIAVGSVLYKDDKNLVRAVMLSEDTAYEGAIFKKKTYLNRHSNGKVESGTLRDNFTFKVEGHESQTMTALKASLITYHETGDVSILTLAERFKLGKNYLDMEFKEGHTCHLRSETVKSGFLANGLTVKQNSVEVEIKADEISFSGTRTNPIIVSFHLAKDQQHDYIIVRVGSGSQVN